MDSRTRGRGEVAIREGEDARHENFGTRGRGT